MRTRKPVLPELTFTVECFPWSGVTDTRERTRAELRAAEKVIHAARQQIKARSRFAKGGCTWDHWIDCINAEERALARLDKATGRDKR